MTNFVGIPEHLANPGYREILSSMNSHDTNEQDIVINPDGSITFEWWNPEIGDMICDEICKKCPGWRKVTDPCAICNPWCG